MVNTGNLLIGMFFGFLAQVATFYQLQGPLKFEWFKNHYWLTVLMGIPISMLFMYSVKNLIIAFDGQMWPSRLIGFSIGDVPSAPKVRFSAKAILYLATKSDNLDRASCFAALSKFSLNEYTTCVFFNIIGLVLQ